MDITQEVTVKIAENLGWSIPEKELADYTEMLKQGRQAFETIMAEDGWYSSMISDVKLRSWPNEWWQTINRHQILSRHLGKMSTSWILKTIR
jgi:hypothetical protein